MALKMPWFLKPKSPICTLKDDEVRRVLEHQLLHYAFPYQGSECIGSLQNVSASTPNLYVKINSKQIAYIHQWYLLDDGKIFKVEHFAIEREFIGKGFGIALARGLAKALQDEFQTETIVFSEISYSADHESFFKRLGAVPRNHRLYPGKPDWIWLLPSRKQH